MATSDAISTTALTFQQLLRAAWNDNPPGAATAHLAGSAEISLFPLADLAKPEPKPCITISVHRISANPNTRNTPARTPDSGQPSGPPFALDVHFLIAAWPKPTTTASDQRLVDQLSFIGWAAQALESVCVLPASLLNTHTHIPGMTNSPFRRIRSGESKPVFGAEEHIELVGENLPAAELSAIWNSAKAAPQPSLTYIARSLLIG